MLPIEKSLLLNWLNSQHLPSVPRVCSHLWVLCLPFSLGGPNFSKWSISTPTLNFHCVIAYWQQEWPKIILSHSLPC